MDTATQIQKALREKLQQLSKEQLIDALTSIYSACCVYSIIEAIKSTQCEEQQLINAAADIQCQKQQIIPGTVFCEQVAIDRCLIEREQTLNESIKNNADEKDI